MLSSSFFLFCFACFWVRNRLQHLHRFALGTHSYRSSIQHSALGLRYGILSELKIIVFIRYTRNLFIEIIL